MGWRHHPKQSVSAVCSEQVLSESSTTGEDNITEDIARAGPFYGCGNWTNGDFPFNDCVDKEVIWWEEGKMTNKVVESAKAILGRSAIQVYQKYKVSVPAEPTPVIIT